MQTLANDLRFALDPVSFARECLGFLPDTWQADVLRSDSKRLLMNCSRQSGKSTTTAVKGLHAALYTPGALILLLSPSQRQSGELFRKVTGFMNRLDVRPALTEDNRLSVTFANGSRIVSLPGVERTTRGFSAPALVIEDEAARCDDSLYIAVRPMLAVSGGQLVLMSTPFGKRGHFFEQWANGGEGWERVEIKATDCPRITAEFLEEERRAMPKLFFDSEYMCQFTETLDQVFDYDQVHGALDSSIKPLFEADPATASAAHSGGVKPLFKG